MLHLHRSNRLECLADALAEVLRTPLPELLTPELIVVQSLGLRRWLQHALAERLGVVMNIDFPFPAELLQRACDGALGPDEHACLFDSDVLPWRVLAELPSLLQEKEAADLARYVHSGESDGLKHWQLAHRIAAVFDRYIAHRPDLLLHPKSPDWPDAWQPRLWEALTRPARRSHPHARLAALTGRDPAGLPQRLAIFGSSSLSPLFLRLIDTLSRTRDVHFFLLAPTRHYWGDTRSARERDRLAARGRDITHVETGHPLLDSLGKVGREFHDAMLDLEGQDATEQFVDPGTDTLLHTLQRDILDLRDARPAGPSAGDRSIQVHRCHGPMREVEVLHDQLLDLFRTLPGLEPRDILVAMPDVGACAPFIDAVFGSPENDRVFIPYRITDREAQAENSLAGAFLRVLALAPSRFPAPAVFDLLESPAVHRRFGLAATDLPVVRGWLDRAAIRWGIDAAHRERFGVPGLAQNTWRAGLRRLLLGYALGGEHDELFGDVLPVREIEGATADVLGGLVEFCEQLFTFAEELPLERPPAAWAALLRRVLHGLFETGDEFADEFRLVARAIDSFAEHAARAGFASPLGFDVVRAHFSAALTDSNSGTGFLGGHVTFCALKPMRSIPFRVIALLGLDTNAFPRREVAAAFDLVARAPRPLDRARRDDDRFLFLEMLLSARDTLYLSYTGSSAKTNAVSPPSVLVSELLDFLGPDTAVRITTEHPLQPFSSRYYQGGALFSYSRANCLPRTPGIPPGPFVAAPLPEPEGDWRAVSLDTLTHFFAHPAKHFLAQRIGLRLPEDSAALEESEPFDIDALTRTGFQQAIVEHALASGDLAAARPLLTATGNLPILHEGQFHLAAMERAVRPLWTNAREALRAPRAPIAIETTIGDWRFDAVLHHLHASGCVRLRAADLKGKDLIRAWLAHLTWNLAPADGTPKTTRLFANDADVSFRPPEDSTQLLRALLDLYGRGLCEPLPFFPQLGFICGKRAWGGGGREKTAPLDFAGRTSPGETYEDDAWNERCFGHLDDWLTDDCRALTEAIYRPIFAHLEGELP